ncbi:MAG TPA: hypothetical protein VFU90_16190, partial [Candidatus Tumulicola sp.]|nr:hypothetical protein [Candidatus Tumulicola sp.]
MGGNLPRVCNFATEFESRKGDFTRFSGSVAATPRRSSKRNRPTTSSSLARATRPPRNIKNGAREVRTSSFARDTLRSETDKSRAKTKGVPPLVEATSARDLLRIARIFVEKSEA